MKEKISLHNIGEDDVMSTNDGTITVDEFVALWQNGLEKLEKQLSDSLYQGSVWFRDGMDCKVLKIGAKGWEKGRVRVNFDIKIGLEFCPDKLEIKRTASSSAAEIDQLESPLDELRRMLNQDS